MADIGIGIVGGGYMGKAHAVAMASVGAVFGTALRPRLAAVCARSPDNARRYRDAYGFERASENWQELVSDDGVEAVVIASPQDTHRQIAEAALALGKPVLCEKPLASSLEDARAMAAAAEKAGVVAMVGFNYIGTPATQYARKLLAEKSLGRIAWFRGEHTEDFLADPAEPASWRTSGEDTGTMGDLAPHMVNCAIAMMGPVAEVMADIETVHAERPGEAGPEAVANDDHGQMMCRFESGAMGHLYFSRVATGRKMGFAYEVHGETGSLRFDQEDQNSLWIYRAEGPEAERGFVRVLAGPEHPAYRAFCLGPGHGTGYQDQVIIEARGFLEAIAGAAPARPSFQDGLVVHRVVEAARASSRERRWRAVADF